MASGATCVQKLDGSRDSAIHTKYRILLRSSSMREPRYPLPRVVYGLMRGHDPCAHRKRGNTGRALLKFGFPWHMPINQAARTTRPSHGLGQRHVPLGAEAPTAGRQTGGGHTVASSPDSDLEAFSHNPAHVGFPLSRTSSELAVRRPGKAPEEAVPNPSPGRHAATRSPPRKQLEQSADSRRVRDWDPPCPALRANPFPEVTDPLCRLPLPTLFHRPEAVHLGDLMRL
ncbi:hypothetical protein L6452_46521 [Arctium lappa]|nr:hypothetical protein L6452_46521 [Arctium lappa]